VQQRGYPSKSVEQGWRADCGMLGFVGFVKPFHPSRAFITKQTFKVQKTVVGFGHKFAPEL